MTQPTASADRTKNPLRPDRLDDIIGQQPAKRLIRLALDSMFERQQGPFPHVLLTGGAGTGKTTFSHAISNELGVDIFEIEAPVSFGTLLELRTRMRTYSVLKIEEIHQQAIRERRGRVGATEPEVLYALMEDRVLYTPQGTLPFPPITVIGTTTDEGMLPDAFMRRFTLKPRLQSYTLEEATELALRTGLLLEVDLRYEAARLVAAASRRNPAEINNLVENVRIFTRPGQRVDRQAVLEVLEVNDVTHDGLTAAMQGMLTFLLTRAKRTNGQGEVVYQASVNTIATALGNSRDTKAIALRVEPYLIEQGYVQVGHAGRLLTPAGVQRARELA